MSRIGCECEERRLAGNPARPIRRPRGAALPGPQCGLASPAALLPQTQVVRLVLNKARRGETRDFDDYKGMWA
jgi:hypothetical protein